MNHLRRHLLLFCLATTLLHAQVPRSEVFHQNYTLKKVVMVGRHGVRSAALTKGERRITPHKWHQWSVGAGKLTERGKLLEEQMGVFFREWIESEHLFDSSASISNQSLIYANSTERTVNTGTHFIQGFAPEESLEVAYNKSIDFDTMDPVFNNVSHRSTGVFKQKVDAEASYGAGENGLQGVFTLLEQDASVLANVLDMSMSPACTQGDTCSFHFENAKVYLHYNWMPRISAGNIYLAQLAASNLILQYYDMPESEGTIFGHTITTEELMAIGRVKETWCKYAMSFPTVGRDAAHFLLEKLNDVISDPTLQFVYLVGHDSNLASLTGALDIKPYTLADTPECHTPLGGKMVIEIWKDTNGKEFVSLNYVYQNLRQILDIQSLSLSNPPMVQPLYLQGFKSNAEGLYSMDDFLNRISEAIDSYAHLNEYTPYDVNLDRHVDMLDAVDIVRYLSDKKCPYFIESVADSNKDDLIDLNDVIDLVKHISTIIK